MVFRVLCFFILCFPFISLSQHIHWASSVKETNDFYRGTYYSTQEVLGPPTAIPEPYEETYWGWIMGYNDLSAMERDPIYVVVGFQEPVMAKQVVVVESVNPGAVSEIIVIDEKGKEISVYKSSVQAVVEPYRVLSFPFNSKSKIVAVKVIGSPSKVKGWNYIDGIGLTNETGPVAIKPRLVSDVHLAGKATRMNDDVNSPYTDKYPVISADGQVLYFTRSKHPQNIDGPNEDIWFSTYLGNKNWSKAQNMGKPLNNSGYNFVTSLMPDINTLLLGNQYNSDGSPGEGGISMTHRVGKGWSIPENVTIKNFKNSAPFSSYYLVNSGKVLLMGIQTNDSYGDMDIYVSFLEKDNSWSSPKNIGKDINTPWEESTPFLASDGVTLYFASKGYVGYGGQDIYMSKRLDDTWMRWSTPMNMGPAINTGAGDLGFSVSADGTKAFTYSYTDEKTLSDIYMVDLSPSMKPEPVVLIKGKVFNAKTGQAIEAKILYEDLNTRKNAGLARSENGVGSYKIVLPRGTHYGFYAEAKGYLSVNESLDIPDTESEYLEIEKDLYLVPIEIGQSIRANNVLFQQSTAILLTTSYSELDRLVQIMKDNPNIMIELSGHTDNVGDANKNLELSLKRVEVVKKYLVQEGIKDTRIVLKAYGGIRPIASNATEETRKQNRRVEFTIIKN